MLDLTFSCKVCGIQYVAPPTDRFRLRWNNYKSCQRNAVDGRTPNQNYFHEHFLSESHNWLINDCEILFIEKTDSSHTTRREFFYMRVLKTIVMFIRNLSPSRHVTCYDLMLIIYWC